jgi:hypothetical protein
MFIFLPYAWNTLHTIHIQNYLKEQVLGNYTFRKPRNYLMSRSDRFQSRSTYAVRANAEQSRAEQ